MLRHRTPATVLTSCPKRQPGSLLVSLLPPALLACYFAFPRLRQPARRGRCICPAGEPHPGWHRRLPSSVGSGAAAAPRGLPLSQRGFGTNSAPKSVSGVALVLFRRAGWKTQRSWREEWSMEQTLVDAGELTFIKTDPEPSFFPFPFPFPFFLFSFLKMFFKTISFILSHHFPSWENESFGWQKQGPRALGKVKRSPAAPQTPQIPPFLAPCECFSACSSVSLCEACDPIQDIELTLIDGTIYANEGVGNGGCRQR